MLAGHRPCCRRLARLLHQRWRPPDLPPLSSAPPPLLPPLDGGAPPLPPLDQAPPPLASLLPASGGNEISFQDGARYVGDVQNGQPNGQGEIAYADGSRYTGQFRDGLRDGQGQMALTDGLIYDGRVLNGIRSMAKAASHGLMALSIPVTSSTVSALARAYTNGHQARAMKAASMIA